MHRCLCHVAFTSRCRFANTCANGALVFFTVVGGLAATVGAVRAVPRLLGKANHPQERNELGFAFQRAGMPGGGKSLVALDKVIAKQAARLQKLRIGWGE